MALRPVWEGAATSGMVDGFLKRKHRLKHPAPDCMNAALHSEINKETDALSYGRVPLNYNRRGCACL